MPEHEEWEWDGREELARLVRKSDHKPILSPQSWDRLPYLGFTAEAKGPPWEIVLFHADHPTAKLLARAPTLLRLLRAVANDPDAMAELAAADRWEIEAVLAELKGCLANDHRRTTGRDPGPR